MKGKIVLFGLVCCLVLLAVGVTYSRYVATGNGSTDLKLANFIFETEEVTKIDLPLVDLVPGSKVSHEFSVSNNLDTKTSEVLTEYEITLQTQLLMPLSYHLYAVDDVDTLLFSCDASTTRDSNNLVVCKSPISELSNTEINIDNYRLDIVFPSIYTDIKYSNLVDYVEISIDSWQKL